MKKPLNYQCSEYDCGPTAIMNAISCLFEADDFPPLFIKVINSYCMDNCNCSGMPCVYGTSRDALRFVAAWINNYAASTGFKLHCVCAEGEAVNLSVDSELSHCLRTGGSAVVNCMLEDIFHYITLTGLQGDRVGVFDPYYDERDNMGKGVECIDDHPMEYNRLVEKTVLDSIDGRDYSMHVLKDRIALCFYRTD